MARIRRKLKITGDEYNFGGGATSSSAAAAAAGGLVKIAKGNMERNHANFDGFLSNGDTVTITQDIGDAIPVKDQYIYFDNAFETQSGTFSYEFLNGATALPAGISFSQNSDSIDQDIGQARFTGTPSVVGKTSFKIKALYPSGSDAEQVELTYILNFLPAGNTPTWAASFGLSYIYNSSDEQTLTAAVTTSYSGATYTLSNLSGWTNTPQIDPDTGRVYLASTGSAVGSSSVAYTVTADLGEYGTVSKTYSGTIYFGPLFAAAYFGPGSAITNIGSMSVVQGNAASHLSDAQIASLWNPNVTSGALRRRDATAYTTSPYRNGENYGLTYSEGNAYSTGDIGYLAPKRGSVHTTGNNGHHVKWFWYVPAGVTSFSVVAVGAGSPGAFTWANKGGGSGGLAYCNAVTCTPGEKFELAVGIGRRSESTNSTYFSGSTWMRRVVDAGHGANEFIVIGYGGGYQSGHPAPLSGRSNPQSSNLTHVENYNSNNSKDGGNASASTHYGTAANFAGGYANNYPGAGAPGYTAEAPNSINASVNGAGGGGGSGKYYSSTYGSSAGGGVGLDGQGSGGHDGNGSGYGGGKGEPSINRETDGSASYYYAGGGGSGGSRGSYGENAWTSSGGVQNRYINGGEHGGGGGGSGTSYGGGSGGCGGIRIIWGFGGAAEDVARAFPSSYTTEDPTIADSTAQLD